MSHLPLSPTIRSITNPLRQKGGLAFDGVTAGTQDLHTIGGNIGTDDFMVSVTFLVPTVVSNNKSIIRLASASTGVPASCFALEIAGPSGTLEGFVTGTTYPGVAKFYTADVTGFVSTYGGKVVTVTLGRSSGAVVFYINGVAQSPTVASSNGGSWADTITSTYCNIGGAGTTAAFNSTIYSAQLFTRALSASDVVDLANKGVSEGDKWASFTAKYTSDFSAGVDGWTVANGTGAGGVTYNAVANCFSYYANASSTSHGMYKAPSTSLTAGKRFKLTFDCAIPSGQTKVNGLGIYPTGSTGDPYLIIGGVSYGGGAAYNLNVIADGAWRTYSVEVLVSNAGTGGSANNPVRFSLNALNNGSQFFAGANSPTDDLFYLKNVVVTQLGCLLDADLSSADPSIGSNVMDRSSNNYTGLISTSGVTQSQKLATQIYGDQTIANIVNNSSVSARAMRGGLAFDGVTTSARISNGSSFPALSTSNCTVYFNILMPATMTTTARLMFISAADDNPARAYGYGIQFESGSLVIRLYGASTIDYNTYTITNFTTTYASRSITLAVVKNSISNTLTVYVNGDVVTGSEGNGGSAPTWAGQINTGYLIWYGARATANIPNITVYSHSIFNRVLSQSEIATLISKGVDSSDQWGTVTPIMSGSTLNGDFEASPGSVTTPWVTRQASTWIASDLTASGTTFEAATDSVHGGTYSCKIVSAASSAFWQLYQNSLTSSYGKWYRVSFWARSDAASSFIVNQVQTPTLYTVNTTTAWTYYSFEFTSAYSNAGIRFQPSSTGSTNGKTFWIDDVVIERVGCLLDADLATGVGYQAPDRSTNRYHGLLTTTGISHTREERFGQAIYTISADGYLGDTTSRACIPADARIDSITAYSAGTPTFTIGDDSGSAANLVGSVTLSASTVTSLTLLKRFLTTGTKGRIYVDFTAGAASTTFTVNYTTTGNY